LWCAVDTDESDAIAQVEFGRFVKLAKGKVKYTERYIVKHGDSKEALPSRSNSTVGAMGDSFSRSTSCIGVTISETLKEEVPTDRRSLRAEVEAAGRALPTDDEVSALSRKFNAAIDNILVPGQAKTWSTLFKVRMAPRLDGPARPLSRCRQPTRCFES
jgi:hypothetical protein